MKGVVGQDEEASEAKAPAGLPGAASPPGRRRRRGGELSSEGPPLSSDSVSLGALRRAGEKL